jgi:hypothetical protein
VDGHDTEINPFATTPRLADHLVPSKISVCPLRFTATQNDSVAHDTSISRSLTVPAEGVWNVDQEWPLNVPIVLGPGIPFAPTVAQKVTVGQEISYVAVGPTDTGGDHDLPSYVTAFPPADRAMQKVDVGHEIELRVPPAPTGCGADHFPARQKRADPFSSTATQDVLDGQETPYKDR